MKRWGTTVNVSLLRSQSSPPSPQPSARRQCSQYPAARPPAPEPAANQNAPINKDSKSPNPRSLKQHTPAEPIPPCFCLLEKSADPSYKYPGVSCTRSRSRSSTRSSFSSPSHISSAFALLLLPSQLPLHAYRICPGTSSSNNGLSRYLRCSQWTPSQYRPIRRMG